MLKPFEVSRGKLIQSFQLFLLQTTQQDDNLLSILLATFYLVVHLISSITFISKWYQGALKLHLDFNNLHVLFKNMFHHSHSFDIMWLCPFLTHSDMQEWVKNTLSSFNL